MTKMETKQKSTQSIEKSINEIWKNNPKIPFMQSKEILALGYKLGIESSNQINKNDNTSTQKDKSFTGTTKELIKYTNNKEKNNKNNKIEYSQENQIKLDVYNDILQIIQHKQDLLDVYTYCKDKADYLRNLVPLRKR